MAFYVQHVYIGSLLQLRKNPIIALVWNYDFNARENGSMKIFFDKKHPVKCDKKVISKYLNNKLYPLFCCKVNALYL